MGLDDVESQGYCFQIDLTWRAVKHGLTVVEVPITFVEREVGDSKMSRDIMTRVAAPDHRAGACATAPGQVRDLVGGTREPRWHTPVSRTGATPYAARRRRPRVLRWVFLALLIVPIVEIAAIIAVGRVIGGWQTLLLLVLRVAARGLDRQARGVAHLDAPCRRRCAAGGCRAASSPTRRSCSSAAPCCSPRASSPTSSASSSSCR